MSLSFAPLTPELWPVFEPFFAAQSETNNCWCMWWRRPATEIAARNRDALREGFRKRVEAGPPPGLVALDGDAPVGWVQITPRADLARFNRGPVVRPASGADLDAVWAVSCFFTAKSHRRQGLMTNLARAACAHAAQNGATAVEAAALSGRYGTITAARGSSDSCQPSCARVSPRSRSAAPRASSCAGCPDLEIPDW